MDVETHRIEVEGYTLQCYVTGVSQAPVVLLHGGAVDSTEISWKGTMQALAQRHRVYAIDWPGYGRSSPPRGAPTTASLIALLGPVLDTLGLKRACLVGLSLGGAVALGFTLEHPDRVQRLGLVSCYGLMSRTPWHLTTFLMSKFPSINRQFWRRAGQSPKATRQALAQIVARPSALSDEMVGDVYRAIRDTRCVETFLDWQRSEVHFNQVTTNFHDQVHRIHTPTLLVHGARDPLVPLSSIEEVARHFPSARLVALQDCGHWPPREQPEACNQALAAFLDTPSPV